jgi:hypothetical protein
MADKGISFYSLYEHVQVVFDENNSLCLSKLKSQQYQTFLFYHLHIYSLIVIKLLSKMLGNKLFISPSLSQ